MNKKYSLITILILLCSTSFSTINVSAFERVTSLSYFSYINSSPIIIREDSNFTDYGFLGDGSESNPFIIENLNITTEEEKGIYIYNTTRYFIIKNCFVNASKDGIVIDTVKEGSAVITDNICTKNSLGGISIYHAPKSQLSNNTCIFNSFWGILVRNSSGSQVNHNICQYSEGSGLAGAGIYVRDSESTVIDNNTCEYNSMVGIVVENSPSTYVVDNNCTNNYDLGGIVIYTSNDTEVTNNLCKDNIMSNIEIFESNDTFILNNECSGRGYGVVVSNSVNVTIDSNRCTENDFLGMYLIRSEGATVSNNILYNTGFRFYEPSKEEFHSHIVYNNLVNDKKFGYFVGIDGLTIKQKDYGQLYLVDCSNSQITNQNLNRTSTGLTMFYCSDSRIQRTVSSNNLYFGVNLVKSSNIEIMNSTFNSNHIGILIEDADRNELTYNTISNNTLWGIVLDLYSSNNTVHHNSFIDNNHFYETSQAYDDGQKNTWSDICSNEGNYYDDYSGTGNYSIDGGAQSYDLYPLAEPPVYVPPNYYGYFAFLSLVLIIPLMILGYKKFRKRKE